MLKLYSSNSQSTPLSKKPVVFEQQDEIVFVNPKVPHLKLTTSRISSSCYLECPNPNLQRLR
jgi:hypothetical protein